MKIVGLCYVMNDSNSYMTLIFALMNLVGTSCFNDVMFRHVAKYVEMKLVSEYDMHNLVWLYMVRSIEDNVIRYLMTKGSCIRFTLLCQGRPMLCYLDYFCFWVRLLYGVCYLPPYLETLPRLDPFKELVKLRHHLYIVPVVYKWNLIICASIPKNKEMHFHEFNILEKLTLLIYSRI